ncbi:MAG TPA: ubiquinol-cytochrome c reductase iron-sulfur subunit [bacterium]|jgi:cytochrome b6-f complex iron-sulfur subunit
MSERFPEKKIKRRDFLGLMGMWTAGVTLVASGLGMLKLVKPVVIPEPSEKLRLGQAADFSPGMVKTIPKEKVRIEVTDQGIAVMSLICTHLGCIVRETHDGFECPCHGSTYKKDGSVTGGPAPRSLKWLEVSQTIDGTLIANKKEEVPIGTYYHA